MYVNRTYIEVFLGLLLAKSEMNHVTTSGTLGDFLDLFTLKEAITEIRNYWVADTYRDRLRPNPYTDDTATLAHTEAV